MDEDKYLVLTKGEDRAAWIEFFEVRDSVVWIAYKSSSKAYPCALRDFMILENPVITGITEEKVVYQNDIPLYHVSQIIDFGTKVRIRFIRRAYLRSRRAAG